MDSIIRLKIEEMSKNIFAFFINVKEQKQNIIAFIKKPDSKLDEKILKNEQKIDKDYYKFFKNTVYNSAKYNLFGIHLRKMLAYSYISNELERIADYLYDMSVFAKDTKINLNERKELVSFINVLSAVFTEIEEMFFCKESKILIQYLKKFNSRKKTQAFSFLKESTKNKEQLLSDYIFNYYSRLIQRIFDHLENVVEYLLLVRSFVEFKNYTKNLI